MRRWLALIAFLVLACLILFAISPLIARLVPPAIRRWVTMGSLLFCLSPYFVWEWLFPPPIELTAYSDSVDYDFRDPVLALQFASANDAIFGEDAVRLVLKHFPKDDNGLADGPAEWANEETDAQADGTKEPG